MFDEFFARRNFSKLITTVRERLHSEDTDLDMLVRELAGSREDIALIRAYIAIRTAAQLTGPPKNADVEEAFKQFRASEKHLDEPQFAEILDIHRELGEIFWATRRAKALAGDPLAIEATAPEDDMALRIVALEKRLDALLEGV